MLTVSGVRHGTALFPAARIWQQPNVGAEDLMLSALPPTMPAVPGSNRRRDEIVAGIAAAVITAHIRQGGTMHRLIEHVVEASVPLAWLSAQDPPPFVAALNPARLTASARQELADWLAAAQQRMG
jgi:hypothetical protein